HISLFLLVSCFSLSAQGQENEGRVRVALSGGDSYEMINVIDLLGEWKSTSSIIPTSIRSTAAERSVSINNGSRVIINDSWKEDYANKMRGCTWAVVDSRLVLMSTDLGKTEIDIVKVGKTGYYEFRLNQITYRKLVIRSDKKEGDKI
ncbi:MAG TPA: hypothetical protein VF141_12655, partial [Chryseolinea sp.]